METPKEHRAYLKITRYSTTLNKCEFSATEQSLEVVVSGRVSWLLSGMSMNQNHLVQSNLWQETTSLWDAPQSTSMPHNIISSSTQGVKSTVAVRGEICFHFTTSVAEKTIQMLLYFPHYCSLVWISLLSSAPVSFPSVHTLKGFPSDCVPLLSWDSFTTDLTVPSDATEFPTFPHEVERMTNRIW